MVTESTNTTNHVNGLTLEQLQALSLRRLAYLIKANWPKVYFGAKPYLDAMTSLETVSDAYGCDDGRSIVRYFLVNATTWRGDIARKVKAELQRRLKGGR